jgi:hypothetical protein
MTLRRRVTVLFIAGLVIAGIDASRRRRPPAETAVCLGDPIEEIRLAPALH